MPSVGEKPFFCHFAGKMSAVSGAGVLASFSTQVRGIKFYDVPTSHICVGDCVTCHLESSNPFDADAIILRLSISSLTLGHLAHEAAVCLAPLLRDGFEASG